MSVLPRTLLITAMVLVALSPAASAAGPETCIEMVFRNFANGLSIIASTGTSIALGFSSGVPGDGLGYVVIITPALCDVGLGQGTAGIGDATALLDDIPELLPLP